METREEKDNQLFNRIAEKYGRKDLVSSSSLARKFQLESLLEFVNREYGKRKFETVLEVGCGVGASSYYLEGKYNNYIGVDYSSQFIELAKNRYGKEGVEYRCSNIKDLKLEKIPDLILGVGVLHHITDLQKAINDLVEISGNDTVFAFIEPNSENLLIQFMRRLRKKIDKTYSEDQIYFSKKELEHIFSDSGFNVAKTKCQGYLSPPFAQIILRPQFLFKPVSILSIFIDKIIQSYFDSSLAWNLMIVANIAR